MEKVRKKAFLNLVKNKKKLKGQEIKFCLELKCQGYLLPNSILSLQDLRNIFLYSARMNNISPNLKGKNIKAKCQCGQELINIHLYECTIFNTSSKIVGKYFMEGFVK